MFLYISTDEDAYNVHVEAGPMRIAYVFDAYRYGTNEVNRLAVIVSSSYICD